MANDRAVGMELEFVLLGRRPFSDSRHEFDLQLLCQGRVLPDAHVTLFTRDLTNCADIHVHDGRKGGIRVVAEAGLLPGRSSPCRG